MTTPDEVFNNYMDEVIEGLTVGIVGTKEVLWLNDENPKSFGMCKLWDRKQPLFKRKGKLYLTKYRLVFSEKTLKSYPLMVSFWFKPKFDGKTFHIRRGFPRRKFIKCKDLILDLRLSGFPKTIELVVDIVQINDTMARRAPILSQIEFHINKPKFFEDIKNARDSASEIHVDKIIDYLKKPEVNPNQYRHGYKIM